MIRRLRESTGPKTRAFLGAFWRLAPWLLGARAATYAAQFAAGRWLGPSEFGKASLCLAAGQWLGALQGLWNIGAVKFASAESAPEKKRAVVSTYFIVSLAWTALCLLLLAALEGPLGRRLRVSGNLYSWGLAYGAALALNSTAYAVLQSDCRFAAQGITEFLYGALVPILFGALYFGGDRSFTAFLAACVLALAVSCCLRLAAARELLRPVFSRDSFAALRSYFFPAIANSVGLAAMEWSLPFIVLAYFNPALVGIYSAYRAGTIMLAKPLGNVIGTVLLPHATQGAARQGAWRRLALLAPLFSLLGAALFLATGWLSLEIFGKRYPVDLVSVALFSLAAALSVLAMAAEALLMARDSRGLWLVGAGKTAAAALAVTLGLLLIPRLRIRGAAATACVSQGFFLVWCFSWRGRDVDGPSSSGLFPLPADT